MASDEVKRVIKRLWGYRFLITFYNLINPDSYDSRKCFTKEISRIITFMKRGIGVLYELCAPSTTPHS